MRHQSEVTGRVGVTESGQRTCQTQNARDGLVGDFAQAILTNIHIFSILTHTGVDMHTTASLANSDFRSKCNGDTILIAKRAHNPFCNHQLVGGILQFSRQEFNLILLIHSVAHGEIAHLAVAVFNQPTAFGDKFHSLGTEILKFAEGARLVVATLVGRQIILLLWSDGVVFQLTHNLKFHSIGSLTESIASLGQSIFWSHLEGFTVLSVEVAKYVKCRNIGKGIDKCCAETRNDIEVRTAGLKEWEQA